MTRRRKMISVIIAAAAIILIGLSAVLLRENTCAGGKDSVCACNASLVQLIMNDTE